MPESLDAYKSLEAYYYHDQHVRTVYYYEGWSMLKAKVNPVTIQQTDNPYEGWIMVKTQTRYIRSGHCR